MRENKIFQGSDIVKEGRNERFISICPYCLNKTEVKIENENVIKMKYICPICQRDYDIFVEKNIQIRSVGTAKNIMIAKECKKEIDNFYKNKKKVPLVFKTNGIKNGKISKK